MRAFILGILLACGLVGAASAQTQTPAAVNGCVYLSGAITLTNGQRSGFLCDVNGKLLTTSSGGGGAGTVTSVGWTGGLVSVATPTTTPAFTIAGTSGGIPYFSSASTWASSAALAANALVIGGGAGAAPATTTTGTGVLTALGLAVNGSGAISLSTSPAFVTPALGVATGTSLALGGAVLGTNVFAATGTANISGNITGGGSINVAGNVGLGSGFTLSWASRATLTSPTLNILQFGQVDAGSPAAQTLRFQSVIAGTSNGNAANATVIASLPTGSGTCGDYIVQTSGTGAAATVQNTPATALTIKCGAVPAVRASATIGTGGYAVGALPAAVIGDRAYVTDQLTTCAVTGAALTGGGAVVCPAFYNGSAWVGG